MIFFGPVLSVDLTFVELRQKSKHLLYLKLNPIEFFSSSRWRCQLHCGPPGPSSVPPRSTYQEDQGWAPGKYVQAKKRRAEWTSQKDNCEPFAQEKKILTHLVDCHLEFLS